MIKINIGKNFCCIGVFWQQTKFRKCLYIAPLPFVVIQFEKVKPNPEYEKMCDELLKSTRGSE